VQEVAGTMATPWRVKAEFQEVYMRALRKFVRNNKGATAIEYGLIAALVAVAAIGGMSALGGSIGNTFNNVSDELDAA
jgi:pilus assembly protein Flp/PilA